MKPGKASKSWTRRRVRPRSSPRGTPSPRPAALPRPDHQVGPVVAVQVLRRHPDAAAARRRRRRSWRPRLRPAAARSRSLPERAKTRGPPPGPPPAITSANPSPSRSPAGHEHAVAQRLLERRRSRRTASPAVAAGRRATCRRTPATRGPPPNPAATSRSPTPSPLTSPTAGRAPPRKFGSSIPKKSASWAKSVAAEDAHPRPAALVRGDDQVGHAVAVHVAGGDVHPAGERSPRTGRSANSSACVLPSSTRTRVGRAGPGADDQVGDAVAVEVARRHPHPAGERRVEDQEQLRAPSGPTAPRSARRPGPGRRRTAERRVARTAHHLSVSRHEDAADQQRPVPRRTAVSADRRTCVPVPSGLSRSRFAKGRKTTPSRGGDDPPVRLHGRVDVGVLPPGLPPSGRRPTSAAKSGRTSRRRADDPGPERPAVLRSRRTPTRGEQEAVRRAPRRWRCRPPQQRSIGTVTRPSPSKVGSSRPGRSRTVTADQERPAVGVAAPSPPTRTMRPSAWTADPSQRSSWSPRSNPLTCPRPRRRIEGAVRVQAQGGDRCRGTSDPERPP